MTKDHGNTLLKHCGEPEIPSPAVRAILTDAVCAGELVREVDALKKQNAALEEANQALANERDYYKQQARERDERAMGKEYE